MQDKMNEMYQNATNTTFSPFVGLKFYNPVEAQPVFDWSNYLTIALLGSLILVGVIGSIVSKVTQSQSMPIKVLQAFSLYDNFAKIITIPKHTEN